MSAKLRLALPVLAVLAAVASAVLHGQDSNLGMLLAGITAGWLSCSAGLVWHRRVGVAVTALAGLGVSLYLGFHHLSEAGSSICSVNEVFNCDAVNQSAWSELAGIPIAFIGSAFYAGLGVMALAGLFTPGAFRHSGALTTLGGAAAVAVSAVLAYASMTLGAWCLFCISLYGVNVLLLVGGLALLRADGEPLGAGVARALGGADRSLAVAVVTGVVVLLVVPKGGGSAAGGAGGGSDTASLEGTVLTTREPVPLDGTEPMLGVPSAPITVVEFADFECPHCALVAPELHDLVSARPEVRVLFKNYPLSNLCNDKITRLFHEHACEAAVAGECARQQGRFWELDRLMFANQTYLDSDSIQFMAKQVGLDEAAFSACMKDPAALEAVKLDAAHGNQMGITGTPTLFVHGLYGDDWVQLRGLVDLVSVLLELKDKGEPLPKPVPPGVEEH